MSQGVESLKSVSKAVLDPNEKGKPLQGSRGWFQRVKEKGSDEKKARPERKEDNNQ